MDDTTKLTESLWTDDDAWRLTETGWSEEKAVLIGSNFLVGNGYLGYRGTSPEQGPDQYVALVVTDTYDCADGRWRELSTVPNPLFVSARAGDTPLSIDTGSEVETWLDMRSGVFGARHTHRLEGAEVLIQVERFASYDQLHLLAQRWSIRSDRDIAVEVDAGIDGDIWSLNGVHLPDVSLANDRGAITATATTGESGVEIAVASVTSLRADNQPAGEIVDQRGRLVRRWSLRVPAGREIVLETVAAVASSNDGLGKPLAAVTEMTLAADVRGYSDLAGASQDHWDRIWRDMDVAIGGSAIDQVALRFSAYHNRICTPAHSDRLPIGARGLSCQAYQGAAFWDQEIYNLPAFLFTEPDIARSLLVYRHRTLDGARRKAARLGYDGAYYAWISGTTGDELCPDYFFEDVLTGRPIRNHFNVWQMHISPDVVTTIARYVDITGDTDYLIDHGAEVAFEVARFLRSFVRYDEWREVYHCIRLLGPDEWHENVDNNAFTNYQTHAALGFAIDTYELLAAEHPVAHAELCEKLALTADEVDGWRRVRDRLLLPAPDEETGLIEQFQGFFDLEDVTPDVVRSRLIDPTEYWGWPNGVAVATQVSKQADVAMLLWLHGDSFDRETAATNYDYYEKRCSHFSSLSHAAHGIVAARIGKLDRALDHFRETAMVDLRAATHALVGGTFIGGIHTAACGGSYQLAVQGFGGLGFRTGMLTIDPALPPEWDSITYPVRWRGMALRVTVSHEAVEIAADRDNAAPVSLLVRGTPAVASPGVTVTV